MHPELDSVCHIRPQSNNKLESTVPDSNSNGQNESGLFNKSRITPINGSLADCSTISSNMFNHPRGISIG